MNLPVKFKLTDINIEQFAIFEDKYKKDGKVLFSSNIDYKLDEANMLIGCFMKFSFEQDKNTFLYLEASCHFGIEKKSWNNFLSEEGKVIIPEYFMEHMGVITVGTARGLLYSKTEKTMFNTFIIPPINISGMVNSDGVFSKE